MMISASAESIGKYLETAGFTLSDVFGMFNDADDGRHIAIEDLDEAIDKLKEVASTLVEQAFHIGSLREKVRAEKHQAHRREVKRPKRVKKKGHA